METPKNGSAKLDVYDVDEERALGGGSDSDVGGVSRSEGSSASRTPLGNEPTRV